MAVDMFLKIDGIAGESTDEKHKDWIEIQSYSHGMNQPVTTSSGVGGRTGGRVNMQDFAITKVIDKASPLLAQTVCNGRHLKDVKLEVCEASENKHVYTVVTLEDAIVSSYQPGGNSGGDKPMESVTFNFGKIKWEYTPLGHDGKQGQKVGPHGWDLTENKKL